MLKGAKREHKTVMEIAQFYTDAFFEDCRKLQHQAARTSSSPPPAASTNISRSSRSCWTPDMPIRPAATCILTPSKLETILCLQRPQRGGSGRRRPRGRGGGHQQAQQERLRPLVHQVQVRRPGAEVGLPLGRGLSRLAHRVLRHLASSISAKTWISTAAASTTPSRTTPTRSPSPRATSATTGATTGCT